MRRALASIAVVSLLVSSVAGCAMHRSSRAVLAAGGGALGIGGAVMYRQEGPDATGADQGFDIGGQVTGSLMIVTGITMLAIAAASSSPPPRTRSTTSPR